VRITWVELKWDCLGIGSHNAASCRHGTKVLREGKEVHKGKGTRYELRVGDIKSESRTNRDYALIPPS